jgi:hypothetical protein
MIVGGEHHLGNTPRDWQLRLSSSTPCQALSHAQLGHSPLVSGVPPRFTLTERDPLIG